MAKKKEEKSEEQKQAFLAKMGKTFLNEATEDGECSTDDMMELAIRLAYVMVRFSYLASMPKNMSEEKKNKASEIATMVYMAYYGRGCEKALRKNGLSYGEAKKEINKAIANNKKKVVKKDKEKSKS